MKAILLAASLLSIASMAHGAIIVYSANLNGPNEAPPNASLGTGFAVVTVDKVANTMRVEATFSGLTGTVTIAHIHAATLVPGAGTAGVATTQPTFAGFPVGVTSGSYDATLDMTLASSYNAAYVTANGGTPASAFTALQASMAAGTSYFNIHSSTFGGGEIRGFLVPEPTTAALVGVAGLGFVARRRRL